MRLAKIARCATVLISSPLFRTDMYLANSSFLVVESRRSPPLKLIVIVVFLDLHVTVWSSPLPSSLPTASYYFSDLRPLHKFARHTANLVVTFSCSTNVELPRLPLLNVVVLDLNVVAFSALDLPEAKPQISHCYLTVLGKSYLYCN